MSSAYRVTATQIATGDLQCGSHTRRKDQMGQSPQTAQVYWNARTFRSRRSLWFEGAQRVPYVLRDDERGHDNAGGTRVRCKTGCASQVGWIRRRARLLRRGFEGWATRAYGDRSYRLCRRSVSKVDRKQREQTGIGSSTPGGGYCGTGNKETGTHNSLGDTGNCDEHLS